jgi:hypothetical protein
MNTCSPTKQPTAMDHLIEDMLRQRKLLLWRKILETFPIEEKHRDAVARKLLPNSEPPLVRKRRTKMKE